VRISTARLLDVSMRRRRRGEFLEESEEAEDVCKQLNLSVCIAPLQKR
jgi:hypothetical protein